MFYRVACSKQSPFKDGTGIEDLFTWIAKTVSSSADEVSSIASFEPDDRVELRQVEPDDELEANAKRSRCCKSA